MGFPHETEKKTQKQLLENINNSFNRVTFMLLRSVVLLPAICGPRPLDSGSVATSGLQRCKRCENISDKQSVRTPARAGPVCVL